MSGSRAASLVLGAALASGTAAAGPALAPVSLECDGSSGAWATGSYVDSAGGGFVSDGFPDCVSAEFWQGVGSEDVEPPFTWLESGEVTSEGTSVTTRIAIGLGFPEGQFASLSIEAGAEG
ncbi:MAG TPA: hypothetical protein VNE71_13845, partial [Myxococcota bacterium]|nr:hypothetical protein [Myxococcota bacterium]